jgi:hypothetical protein
MGCLPLLEDCRLAWAGSTGTVPETRSTMNEDERRIQKHHGGPHTDGSEPKGPYWKRMHRSGFFWVAAFFLFLAMGIFVMTDGFLLRPR